MLSKSAVSERVEMARKIKASVIVVLLVIIMLQQYYKQGMEWTRATKSGWMIDKLSGPAPIIITSNRITIALSSCGDRLPESVVMIKSALLLTKEAIDFHIFTEPHSKEFFLRELNGLQRQFRSLFSFFIHDVSFPDDGSIAYDVWRNLFLPCASQRLFMPTILKHIDAVLYVDTDVLFITPPEDTWALFRQFNSTQAVGLAPEQQGDDYGHYDNWDLPIFGKRGINSGVMLLNMTRMREKPWYEDLIHYYTEYRKLIRFGDQCLINVYFHFHPDMGYLMPCVHNYRPDFCNTTVTCRQPPFVLHGNRRANHVDSPSPEFRQPIYNIIYDAIAEHNPTDPLEILFEVVCEGFRHLDGAKCSRAAHLFIEGLARNITGTYEDIQSKCLPTITT